MTKADELWEKYKWNSERVPTGLMTRNDFLAALAEYGQFVRDRDAEICNTLEASGTTRRSGRFIASAVDCAAAISREPLP